MPPLPSLVTMNKIGSSYEYIVNGQPEYLHGVGYDAPNHAETDDQRQARLDRDFTMMANYDINTILGWDEGLFNDQLMGSAAQHGIGVILPFDLKVNAAYEQAGVRQLLLQQVAARVDHFKDAPALRMWGLGNEVLHDIADMRSARANGFALFEQQAADMIHSKDPNHPVIYREAEDAYFEPLARALRINGQPRPWFVYGMNFFSPRLEAALSNGPILTVDNPVVITEFGAAGLPPAWRPDGYTGLWDILRSHKDRVMGGFAYVWNTAGPEAVDLDFGLTDDNGVPVDGTVAALAMKYKADDLEDQS